MTQIYTCQCPYGCGAEIKSSPQPSYFPEDHEAYDEWSEEWNVRCEAFLEDHDCEEAPAN